MSVQHHPKHTGSTLTSFDTVSKSSALQKYSFSKDSRFKGTKVDHHNCGYNLPSGFGQPKARGTGFGYGERTVAGVKSGKELIFC